MAGLSDPFACQSTFTNFSCFSRQIRKIFKDGRREKACPLLGRRPALSWEGGLPSPGKEACPLLGRRPALSYEGGLPRPGKEAYPCLGRRPTLA